MPDCTGSATVEAVELGCLARRALAEAGWARVGAVFEHSFYIAAPRHWVCVGSTAMGSGPINVRCRRGHAMDWRASGIRVHDSVYIHPPAVRLASGLALSLAGAGTWAPERPGAPSRGRVRAGLAGLEAVVDARVPGTGLGALARPARSAARLPAVAAAAFPPAMRLHALLRAAFASGATPAATDVCCLEPLLGLGPGLTPSGDDFVAGAFIALHLLGRDDLRDALWRPLRTRVCGATNEISRAHLSAAARGLASAALHELLNATVAGDVRSLDARITGIDAVGHTSGWDALAGAVTVLRAWLEAKKGTF